MKLLPLLLLFLTPAPVVAIKHPTTRAVSYPSSENSGFVAALALSSALELRGGQASSEAADVVPNSPATGSAVMTYLSTAASALAEAIRSGPHVSGVASLFVVTAITVVPLSMIHRGWSFSVGYGASIGVMGLALLKSFEAPLLPTASSSPAQHLATATALYGARLTAYLLLREATVEGKKEGTAKFDEGSPLLKRIPLALSVSIFYAFLVSPVMYALRGASQDLPGGLNALQWASVVLAYAGFALEAVADQHKFVVKRRHKVPYDRDAKKKEFVGPTGGSYALCRHPNYFGHVLFWIGLFLGGAAGPYGKDPVAWACGVLGLYGITSIMKKASKRLDEKQADSYGGQTAFEEWSGRVKGSLAPAFLGG